MTTYYPIAYTVPQYMDANGNPYSGAVLKAYRAGTTTNIVFATDTAGGTTVTSVALNANGNPVVSSNVIIPHVAEEYKLMLYPSQSAADSDTGAIWSVDNIPLSGSQNAERYLGYAADTGSADAYTVSPVPDISAYAAGQVVTLKPANTNTGASTISVSGLATKDIKDANGNALSAGQLSSSGIYQLTYNGTYWVLGNVNQFYANKPLSSSVNWNTGILIPGLYITSGTSYTGTTPLGSGIEHTGSLQVLGAGNDLYQVWRNGLISQRWERMTTDGGSNWTGWKEQANTFAYSTTSAVDTLVNADSGTLQVLTGTTDRTWTLPSASVCGTNWFMLVRNSCTNSAALTIARSGSDTIDGDTSIDLRSGQVRAIYCTGSSTFASVVLSGALHRITSGSYALNADLSTALPIDDTTPDIAEGAEFISTSILVEGNTNSTYTLYCVLTGNLSAAAAIQGVSLYVASACVNAQSITATGATACQAFCLQGSATVGGNATYVVSARIGNNAGNAVRINGTGSARHFGGSQKAVLTVFVLETGA